MKAADNRATARRSSLYAVTIEIGDRRITGRIRDHSDRGCRVKLDEPLRFDDDEVAVVRAEHRMKGTIAWRNATSVGIAFAKTPPEDMFSPSIRIDASKRDAPQQQRFRRPGLGQESLSGIETEHGRRWSQGDREPTN